MIPPRRFARTSARSASTPRSARRRATGTSTPRARRTTTPTSSTTRVTCRSDPDGPFEFKEGDDEEIAAAAVELSTNGGGPSAGDVLRTYRLALITDQSYSTYFGGPANVTAAKVALMNRVNQIYEDETSIRLVLIDDTDKTNLNTDADAIGANGPCGSAPCYTTAQLAGCAGGTLGRNRIVLGQIIGASQLRHRPPRSRQERRRRREPGRRRRQLEGRRLHRPAEPRGRLLRRRLRGARDGPPVRAATTRSTARN